MYVFNFLKVYSADVIEIKKRKCEHNNFMAFPNWSSNEWSIHLVRIRYIIFFRKYIITSL